MKRQLKGRELEDIITSVNDYENSGAWEAEFLADPERFTAAHGLLPGEAGRLGRWLAKDPCFHHRPPGCPYIRLCVVCQKVKNDIHAYHDELRRLTAGLQSLACGFVAYQFLDERLVVLERGDDKLTAYRSAITGGRAYIEISDGGDTTYTTLYADAETIAATVQAQREYAERMRAEYRLGE